MSNMSTFVSGKTNNLTNINFPLTASTDTMPSNRHSCDPVHSLSTHSLDHLLLYIVEVYRTPNHVEQSLVLSSSLFFFNINVILPVTFHSWFCFWPYYFSSYFSCHLVTHPIHILVVFCYVSNVITRVKLIILFLSGLFYFTSLRSQCLWLSFSCPFK